MKKTNDLSTVHKNNKKKPIRRVRRKRKNKKLSSTISKTDKKHTKKEKGGSSLKPVLNKYKQLPSTENRALGRSLPSFVEHCKPKGIQSNSYNIWLNTMSSLKAAPKKRYPRRSNNGKIRRAVVPWKNGIVSVPNVNAVHLQRTINNDASVLSKFMSFNWPNPCFHHKLDEKTNNVSINEFTEMDSGHKQHLIAYDNQSQKVCLFAKIAREKVLRKLGGRNNAKRLRFFSSEMCRCMRNIPRGQQCGSVDNGYFIVGERANRNAPGTGVYKCKPNIKKKDFESVQCLAREIVNDMEEAIRPLTRHLHLEESVAHQVRNGRILETVGTYATAMSMGITYQSKCHTDKDFYYSLLTVAAPSQRDDKRIIYWFVFPSYNVKVGLRTGDVLLFNPMIPHCCSNPRIEGSTILSSYSSQTTLFRSVGGSCV